MIAKGSNTRLFMQTVTGAIDKEANKAGAAQQKEGAKSSFAAVKVCQHVTYACFATPIEKANVTNGGRMLQARVRVSSIHAGQCISSC